MKVKLWWWRGCEGEMVVVQMLVVAEGFTYIAVDIKYKAVENLSSGERGETKKSDI